MGASRPAATDPHARAWREGPETTLVDTQNGGTIRLWEPGYRIHETVFHGDYLYYVRFPTATGVAGAEVFEFNLSSQQPRKIIDGYNIAVSVNGDIAYSVWDSGGAHTAAIYARSGVTRPSQDGIGMFAWPPGRWLTYSGGYRGDILPIEQFILDTTTFRTREYAETMPCNCDGGARAVVPRQRPFYLYQIGSRPQSTH